MTKTFSVTEAQRELILETARLAVSSKRCEELETFISLGKRLAGESRISAGTAVARTGNTRHAKPQNPKSQQPIPIRVRSKDRSENARQAFIKLDRPASVPDILNAMMQNGTPIGGKFPRQNARSLFKERKEIFEKIGPALYALREWPAEKKHGKQAKAQ
jgi:hypothetical protein